MVGQELDRSFAALSMPREAFWVQDDSARFLVILRNAVTKDLKQLTTYSHLYITNASTYPSAG